MSIPTEAANLPEPPANEGAVSFKTGGPGTFTGLVDNGAEGAGNIYPGTVKSWQRTTSQYQGQAPKDQFAFLVALDAYADRGLLVYYTGVNAVHPKSKLPPFLRAIGAAIPTPESPSLPQGIPGKRAKFLVKNERGTDGQLRPKIKEVLPA